MAKLGPSPNIDETGKTWRNMPITRLGAFIAGESVVLELDKDRVLIAAANGVTHQPPGVIRPGRLTAIGLMIDTAQVAVSSAVITASLPSEFGQSFGHETTTVFGNTWNTHR